MSPPEVRMLLIRDNKFLGEIDLADFDLSDEQDREYLLDEIANLVTERQLAVTSSGVVRAHFYGCDESHAPDARCNGPVANLERNLPPFH
jgi:hypothetical protein